jgi:hypothetical protein
MGDVAFAIFGGGVRAKGRLVNFVCRRITGSDLHLIHMSFYAFPLSLMANFSSRR